LAALAALAATATSTAAATSTPLLGAVTAFALVLLAALSFALVRPLVKRGSAIADLGARARVADFGSAVGAALILLFRL
ncbi:MAG: hypothetical protein GWP48_02670, partial [Actinobacteria bacterium]|nr:hypothetical protein [Actinomycetota bacterium]